MIVDIEIRRDGDPVYGKLRDLNISHFNKDGDISFIQVPLEQSRDGYVWDYCNGGGVLDQPDPDHMSWDNRPVKKVHTAKINKYTVEEILYNRRDEILDALEFNTPNKFILDIETEIGDEFPDPTTALQRVNALAICNSRDKKITVLGLQEIGMHDFDKIQSDINKHFAKYGDTWAFNYVPFESEYDMLYTFFAKLIHKMPLITGWNVLNFDWEYLLNRAERIKVNPSMAGQLRGKNRIPQHKLIVDYLDIVKKWDRVIKIKENYKLDYIAEKSTGIAKIKYPGTLKELYEKDYVKFIFYNAVDTILVHYIDQELNTMSTFFKLAHIAEVEVNRAFSPVHVQEALMTREYYRRGAVMVANDKDLVEQRHFEGAYVKDPVKGLHEWVVCFDFASLYPNTMMQFNISPEAYLGKRDLLSDVVADENTIVCANGNMFDNSKDSVLRTILQELYGARKETKGKKLAINKEIDYLERHLQQL